VSGCTLPWAAHRDAQRRTLASVAPARLTAARAPATHVLHVRVHASPAYLAQTAQGERHVRDVIADASATLAASIDAELAIDDVRPWPEAPRVDRLDASVAALRVTDEGEGADLVIGFIGGLPTMEESFHLVGMSETPGKHLVVRAPANEVDAVNRAFDELSEEERTRIRRARRRHREVAILLHEMGHALGAQHDTEHGSLMYPAYERTMSTFGPAALASMRATLAKRSAAPAPAPDAHAIAPAPDAPSTGATSASAPAPATAPPAPSIAIPPELRPQDRDRWVDIAKTSDPEAAWALAKPLFAAYPEVYEVQDLRCKIAMTRGMSYDAARAECDPLMKLTMRGAGPRK
jgi:hypothetical protein